ncbi:MAG: hypothetical protein JKY37_20265 [Nannocystaceae bacterium]|nr:hypothetical protein [Nannocystaceae bacterium]
MHRAGELDNARIVIIGHDDEEQVGQARANSIEMWLTGNRKAWVAIATEFGGLTDILAYLEFLDESRGWHCGVTAVDAVENAASKAAVAAFQTEFNERFEGKLLDDGVCGTETLGAVFDVLAHELARWLDKHGLPPDHVASLDIEYLAAPAGVKVRGGLDGASVPGLDVLVGEAAWMDGESMMPHSLYESEVLHVLPLVVSPEVGGWAIGALTVVSDLTPGETMLPETYILSSTDGSYESRLVLPDNATDTGLLELLFDDLPTDARFNLRVEIEGVGRYVVFTDLSYSGLHRNAVETAPTKAR